MKTEFVLTIDVNGKFCIHFRHHDKNDSLEQKALGEFIKQAKNKGICIKNKSGYLNSSACQSWENYEIQIKE